MPYSIKKCNCRDSKGKKGKYIVTKKGKSKQLSCHTSKAKAKAAIRARYVHEKHQYIVEKVFLTILKESSKSIKKFAGSHPEESYEYGWPAFKEEEFNKDGKTTWHEDREWTRQYFKSIGMLK